MMSQIYSPPETPMFFRALLVATLLVLGFIGESAAYRRYTGLSRWRSILLSLLAVGVTIFFITLPHQDRMDPKPMILMALLPLLALPFAVRLYRKWIGGWLTDAEKLPGADGVRAWLGFGNLVCAVLIPLCAWQVFHISLISLFALTFGLLLAYPIFNMASATPAPAKTAATEDLSSEREKVLQLLEAGKITADESAELLNALSHTVAPRAPAPSELELTPQRKIVLLGAALLLAGFFLPWFNLQPGQMLNELIMKQGLGDKTAPFNVMPQVLANTTVEIRAADIARGIGWWILALGIGAAVLPFFAINLKADMQKKLILAALAVGAFLILYLLSEQARYAGVGIVLAMVGYALAIVGTVKEPRHH